MITGWLAALAWGGVALGVLGVTAVLFGIIGIAYRVLDAGVVRPWMLVVAGALAFVGGFATLGYFVGLDV